MFVSEYACDRCEVTGTYRSGAIGYYRLADGTELSFLSQPVWCFACEAIRGAERLPELVSLQEIADDLEANGLSDEAIENAAFVGKSPEACLAERRHQSRVAIQWRRRRKTAPRCLDCKSTDLIFYAPNIEDSLNSFPHPGCGGTFRETRSWHASQGAYQALEDEA